MNLICRQALKKVFTVFLCIITVSAVMPVTVFAQGNTSGVLYQCQRWDGTNTLYNDGELVISGEENIQYNPLTGEWSDGWLDGYDSYVKTVTYAEGVKKIEGPGRFSFFENLTAVNLPSSLENMSGFISSLRFKIAVNENNPVYSSDGNGALYNKDKTELLRYCNNEQSSYAIPASVSQIRSGAFKGCSGLESITIPDGVTEIGGDAFSGCTGLKSITIPDSVTEIGEYAVGFIYDSELLDYIPMKGFTIIGVKGSAAETYAQSNGFTFTEISSEPHIHNYEEKITKQPTCTENGEKIYTCSCGDSYTEALPFADHKDSDGDGICDVCGHKMVSVNPGVARLCIISPSEPTDGYVDAMIVVDNAAGLTNLEFHIGYDHDMLEYVSCEQILDTDDAVFDFELNEDGKIVCDLSYTNANTEDSISLLNVKFKILKSENTVLSVNNHECNLMVLSGMTIINVYDPEPVEPTQEARIDMEISDTEQTDGYLDLDVVINNAFGLSELSFNMAYDQDVLEYVSSEQILDMEDGAFTAGLSEDGNIGCALVYTDANTEDSLSLFRVRFRILKSGKAAFSIYPDGSNLLIIGKTVSFNVEAPKTEAKIQINKIHSEQTDGYLDIEVTMDNASGLSELLFNIAYDHDILEYVSAEQTLNMEDGAFTVGLNEDGNIACALAYMSANTEDSISLYKVRFKILKKDAQSCNFTVNPIECNLPVSGYMTGVLIAPTIVIIPPDYTLGDINGDDKITSSDARTALRIALKLESASETVLLAADVNGDKKVTSSDARTILRVALKLQSF